MTDTEKIYQLLTDSKNPVWWLIPNNANFLELAKYLANAGITVQSWIPVTERLPETDNQNTHAYDVLVYIPKREGCSQHGVYIGKLKTVAADDGTGNFWGLRREACDWTVWGWSYFNTPVVTHWMPLPEPLKEE